MRVALNILLAVLVALVSLPLCAAAVAATRGHVHPSREARRYTLRQEVRRERAARLCKAQERLGLRCHVQERPGTPRDLTGLGCVCE